VLFAPSRIVNVANRAVLVSRHRIDGTGNFYFEDYFIFDRQQNLPVNLAVGRATAAELSKVLPPRRSVWKGGGFDVSSLHCASGVWKDGDANRSPSGGRVNIQFGIRGNTVVVLNTRYDPSFRNE